MVMWRRTNLSTHVNDAPQEQPVSTPGMHNDLLLIIAGLHCLIYPACV